MQRSMAIPELAVKPPLHTEIIPAVLANLRFREMVSKSGHGVPLIIALEREGGYVSTYRTECFSGDSEESPLNLPYAERLVKTLLYLRGGCRLVVAGPDAVGRHIQKVYSHTGDRAFDVRLMETVYASPFTVELTDTDRAPDSSERTLRLGGNLDGCRIGFDLGASDRKVAAVIDGNPVFTEEVAWEPGKATDPDYHFNEINASLKAAARHMPRVDAIGGSAAGAYVNNQPRVASLFRGISKDLFDSKIVNLFRDLKQAWGGIPFEVANDGDVTALAGAMSLKEGAVLGIAMGSSQAGGYVTPGGTLTDWLNELAFCPFDYSPDGPVDEWSGDVGCGVQYFSQQAVFRLASAAGIAVDESLGPADRLKSVQEHLHAGDDRARRIWETIGVYTGYAIAHYADFYDTRHVLILGRVTSGDGGAIILGKAREVLRVEFPELADMITIHIPDEADRRLGQAVAAASLPIVTR